MVRCLALALMLVPAAAWSAEIVKYRCVEWKAKHIHDSEKADKISETLTSLGCELERHAHDGHEDVKYRCIEWRQLELESHEEAHQWEDWLKEFQFETEHHHRTVDSSSDLVDLSLDQSVQPSTRR